MIHQNWWMVLDMDTPVKLDRLFVYGALELDPDKEHDLSANLIMVTGLGGMLIVGWPNNTMSHPVFIRLTGNHDTPDFPINQHLNLGAKALGIFGRAQFYGEANAVHWTRLAAPLAKGNDDKQFLILTVFFIIRD